MNEITSKGIIWKDEERGQKDKERQACNSELLTYGA